MKMAAISQAIHQGYFPTYTTTTTTNPNIISPPPHPPPPPIILTDSNLFSKYHAVYHNNGVLRHLGLRLLDDLITEFRLSGYKPNKIITNYDTIMRIQQEVEVQVGQIKMEDKERTEQLLLFTLLAAAVEDGILTAYRGINIVVKDVTKDALSRIFICENDRAGIEIRDLK